MIKNGDLTLKKRNSTFTPALTNRFQQSRPIS
jgi:hypothetical protein